MQGDIFKAALLSVIPTAPKGVYCVVKEIDGKVTVELAPGLQLLFTPDSISDMRWPSPVLGVLQTNEKNGQVLEPVFVPFNWKKKHKKWVSKRTPTTNWG